MKLHVGCGDKYYKEYTNIDLYDFDPKDTSRDGARYDIKMDLRNLEFEEDTIDEIMFIHGFEHFTRYEGLSVLERWHKILKPGGFIHLEMPDFGRVHKLSFLPKFLFNSNKKRYSTNIVNDMFYGNQWSSLEYETHRFLWSKKDLKKELEKIGYDVTFISNSAFFHIPFRDMLVIAHKSGANKIDFKERSINGKVYKIDLFQNLKRQINGLRHIFKPFSR